MKKIVTSLFLILCGVLTFVGLLFSSNVAAENLKDSKGYTMFYPRSNNVPITVPTYQSVDTEFRGVWVSFFAGDIKGYSNDNQLKQELLDVLDTMEEYHLNAIMFHLRTHNDALYDTDLAPMSSYIKGFDFEKWDYVEWFINECHKRGIEFHAWLNPYRISSSTTAEAIKTKYANYPNNPASNLDNVLINADGEAILDPGRPEVRDYITQVCMEIAEKYDVDAIHFDDYFYIGDVDDSETRSLYGTKNQNYENFRRESVDKFIEQLSTELRDFNEKNNRTVQLGISPSGVYRNVSKYVPVSDYKWDENGNLTYPVGTAGSAMQHYQADLYCDTVKWINNEWIDYITPQVYNGLDCDAACYATVCEWWNAVVKNKKVNLYIGTGLYKKGSSDSGSWYTMETEWYNQLRFNQKLENVKGTCIYTFKSFAKFDNTTAVILVKSNCFNRYTKLAALPYYEGKFDSQKSESVTNLKIYQASNKIALTWDKLEDAKSYIIYQYTDVLDVNDPTQILGIAGNDENLDYVSFNAKYSSSKGTYFAVVPMTKSNELCSESVISIEEKGEFDVSKMPVVTFFPTEVTGTITQNSKLNVLFNEGIVNFGSSVSYELYVCEGSTFDIEKATKLTLTQTSNTYYTNVQMNDYGTPMTLRVKATTEFGSTWSDDISIHITYDSASSILKDIYRFIDIYMNKLYEEEE